jgi:hypothetical protein
VLRHPWTGSEICEAAKRYRKELAHRQEREAQTLATLTGWSLADIRAKTPAGGGPAPLGKNWWERLWSR